jgi:hypothetical protein
MSTTGIERAGRKLLASPSAVFVAVLTAGFATASFAHHAGLYVPNSARQSVVLACPRTKEPCPAKAISKTSAISSQRKAAAAAPAPTPSSTPSQTVTATVAANEASTEKHASGKTGAGVSLPLPDFSTPELSRFISPL